MDASHCSSILSSLPYGLCVVDGEGRIVEVNNTLKGLLGWQQAGCEGQPLAHCLEQAISDPAQALRWSVALSRALVHGEAANMDLPVRFRSESDGEGQIVVAGEVFPWRDAGGEILGAIVLLRGAGGDARLQGVRRRFLSLISHELGSPLANVAAATERLGQVLDMGDMQQRRLLQIIRAEVNRLRRLLGYFLAEPGPDGPPRPTLGLITLPPLLRRVAQTFGVREGGPDLVLDIAPHLPFVWGDADRIEEVLSNLVDNALRHAPPGTEIILAARDREADVLVSVTDQGEGVADDQRAWLFEPLARGEKARMAAGQGLGLYIARTLIRSLGGEIWHEQPPEGGARFCFTLPQAQRSLDAE